MIKNGLKVAYLLPSLLSFLMFFYSPVAHAELWGYVDDKGVVHLSFDRLDDRYVLFFQGDVSLAPQADFQKQNTEAADIVLAPAVDSKIQTFFEISPQVKAVKHLLKDAAKMHQIDIELLLALVATESGFNAKAVSPKGAIGLMQLMPSTAKRFGVSADHQTTVEQKLTDPKININAGAKYLRFLLNMFPGNLELALASYNAGEGAVQRAGNKVPNYKETQNYVRAILQTYKALKPPEFLAALNTAKSVQTAPSRVKMVIGGAAGRGNMIAPASASTLPPATAVLN